MASEPSPTTSGTRAPVRGRLWQMLPVDWGRVEQVTNEPVPGHIRRWWFALGGTPAYLFFVQITTGILLSFVLLFIGNYYYCMLALLPVIFRTDARISIALCAFMMLCSVAGATEPLVKLLDLQYLVINLLLLLLMMSILALKILWPRVEIASRRR